MCSILRQAKKTERVLDEDERDTGKRILSEFNKHFAGDINQVASVEVIPSPECKTNSSPILKAEQHIGIAMWCIPILYHTAYTTWKADKWKLSYKDMNNITRVIVFFCPDNRTAWNCRKQMVLNNELCLNDERKFSELVLKLHPKSLEAYSHRRWILQNISTNLYFYGIVEKWSSIKDDLLCEKWCYDSDEKLNVYWEEVREVINVENHVCKITAAGHKNNYNSWSHRIFVHELFVQTCIDMCAENEKTCQKCKRKFLDLISQHLKQVIISMCSLLELNISDTSGWWFLRHIVKRWIELRVSLEDFEVTELFEMFNALITQSNKLIDLFNSGVEALWHHRRDMFMLYWNFSKLHPNLFKVQKFDFKTEKTFCERFLNIKNDSYQKVLCEKHANYLHCVWGKLNPVSKK